MAGWVALTGVFEAVAAASAARKQLIPATRETVSFKKLPAAQVPGLPGMNAKANTVGIALGVATAAGIAGHALGRAASKGKSEGKEG